MSWLSNVGNVFKKILHIGEEVATVAEPLVANFFPDVTPIYNTAIGLAVSVEAASVASTGTGAQKLAQLTANLVPLAEKFASDNGIVWPTAEISKWASAVVDTLNMVPSNDVKKPVLGVNMGTLLTDNSASMGK